MGSSKESFSLQFIIINFFACNQKMELIQSCGIRLTHWVSFVVSLLRAWTRVWFIRSSSPFVFWGWYGLLIRCSTPVHTNKDLTHNHVLAVHFVHKPCDPIDKFSALGPWSDIIVSGHPCWQNSENRKSATPTAVLPFRGAASGHFEK